MILTIDKTHELKGNGYLLGVDNENGSEQLIINIGYEELVNKDAYLEFENKNGKYTTEKLTIENNQVKYTLPNGLLKNGLITVQAVFRFNGYEWKSLKRQFKVEDAINAGEDLPQEYPDFIGNAQKILDGITMQAEKVDEVLTTEEERKAAELVRAQNEATRQETETVRELTEIERKTAESARQTAETERQANETARVDAETVRRTEFSGWANSLGNLNTYDKRLINLEEAGVGILFDYVTHNTTAYSKTVPAKALPYAKVNGITGAKSIYSVSKNIFDGVWESGSITLNNGTDMEEVNSQRTGYILIEGNTYYTTTKQISVNQKVRFYDKDKVYLGANNYSGNRMEVVRYLTPNDAKYMRISIDTADPIVAFQVEKGMVSTEYEPYKATTYALPLADNYIRVQPNGSVIFENDNAQAVPSEIIYAVKRG